MPAAGKAVPTVDVATGKASEAPVNFRNVQRQRLPGNQAMLRLQRKCSCNGSGSCESCKPARNPEIQTKVPIGPRDDAFEREADSTAERIIRMNALQTLRLAAAPEQVQRAGREDDDEFDQGKVQRKPTGSGSPAPSLSASNLTRGGSPLPNPVKNYFETRFARDFSQVRVHSGADAEQANRDVQAHAFTYGRHIWMGRGHSVGPNSLVAHELTHVVQQTDPPPLSYRAVDVVAAPPRIARQPAAEVEADPAAQNATQDEAKTADEEPTEPKKPEVDELNYAFIYDGGAYGQAARAFIKKYQPEYKIVAAQSFEEMFDRLYADLHNLRQGHKAHIEEIIIVTHANAAGGMKIPLTRGDVGRHRIFNIWDLADLQKEFRNKMDAQFSKRRHEVVTEMFDDSTRVTVRGCEFGQSQEAMDALRSFMGGQAYVFAPKAYQGYEELRIGSSFLKTPEEAFDFLIKQDYLPPELQPMPDEDKRAYIARVFGVHGTIPADFLVIGPEAHAALAAAIAAHQGTQAEAEPLKDRPDASVGAGDLWGSSTPSLLGEDPELDVLTIDEIETRARALNNPYRPQNAAMLQRLRSAWTRKSLSSAASRCKDSGDPLCGLPPEEIFGDSNIEAGDAARFPGPRYAPDTFETQTLTPPSKTADAAKKTGEFAEPLGVAEPKAADQGPTPDEDKEPDPALAQAAYKRAHDFSKSGPPPPPPPDLRTMSEADLGAEYRSALADAGHPERLAAVEDEIARRIDDPEHPGFGVALPRDLPPGQPANAGVDPDIALKILENASKGEFPWKPESGKVGRVAWFVTKGNPYTSRDIAGKIKIEVELVKTEGGLVFREADMVAIFEKQKLEIAPRIEAEFRSSLKLDSTTPFTRKMRRNFERLLKGAAEKRMWETIGEQVRASPSGVGEVILENSQFSTRQGDGRFAVVRDAAKIRLRGGIGRLLESLKEQGIESDATLTTIAEEVAAGQKWAGRVRGAFRWGGRILIVVGLANDAYRIITARDKTRTAISVAGGWAGATAAGALFAELWTPADIAGPGAWLVHGVGTLIAGGIGYFLGSETTTTVYDLAIESENVTGSQ
jgi:Domain of unknown function (DUF4157)